MRTTLSERYNTAEALFTEALHAIHDARHAGTITAELADQRETWLTSRFDTCGVERQIAACRAMLLVCRRHEITYSDVLAMTGEK